MTIAMQSRQMHDPARLGLAEGARAFLAGVEGGERPGADPELVRLATVIYAYTPRGSTDLGPWMSGDRPDPLGLNAEMYYLMKGFRKDVYAGREPRETRSVEAILADMNEAVEDAAAKLVKIAEGVA